MALQVSPSIAKNEDKSDLMNARKRLPVALADGGSGETGALGPRSGPSAPRIVAAWLLLTFAALFVLSVPAAAQTTIWSATLTAKNLGFGDRGCDNSATQAGRRCSNSNTLSDDEFTDDGTGYAVTALYVTSSGNLILSLDTAATTATQGLTLMIGGNSYAFADGAANSSKTRWTWINSGLTWSNGDEVAVSLVEADADATGQPTITGAPQVGKTLTAETDDIEDDNGVPSSASDFTYQWVRVDGSNNETNIGSNSSTYTVTAADMGHTIKVKVSFTDLRGHSEGPLTSDAYPSTGTVVAAAGACPSDYDWCATLTVEDQDGDGLYFVYNDKFGGLTNNPFYHNGETFNVSEVYYNVNDSEILVAVDPRVPRGTVFKLGDHTFTADDESQCCGNQDRWPRPSDLFWYDSQEITVSLVFGSFHTPLQNPPTVSIDNASAPEDADFLQFTIRLSRKVEWYGIRLDFETLTTGTATAGTDYVASSLTLDIPSNKRSWEIGVGLIEDSVSDANETVKVRISNAQLIGDDGEPFQSLTITDDQATGTINAPTTTTTNISNVNMRINDTRARRQRLAPFHGQALAALGRICLLRLRDADDRLGDGRDGLSDSPQLSELDG